MLFRWSNGYCSSVEFTTDEQSFVVNAAEAAQEFLANNSYGELHICVNGAWLHLSSNKKTYIINDGRGMGLERIETELFFVQNKIMKMAHVTHEHAAALKNFILDVTDMLPDEIL